MVETVPMHWFAAHMAVATHPKFVPVLQVGQAILVKFPFVLVSMAHQHQFAAI